MPVQYIILIGRDAAVHCIRTAEEHGRAKPYSQNEEEDRHGCPAFRHGFFLAGSTV